MQAATKRSLAGSVCNGHMFGCSTASSRSLAKPRASGVHINIDQERNNICVSIYIYIKIENMHTHKYIQYAHILMAKRTSMNSNL